MPEFAAAYEFLTGAPPPRTLRRLACDGTTARIRIRCPRSHAHRDCELCRRHHDLLASLGLLADRAPVLSPRARSARGRSIARSTRWSMRAFVRPSEVDS